MFETKYFGLNMYLWMLLLIILIILIKCNNFETIEPQIVQEQFSYYDLSLNNNVQKNNKPNIKIYLFYAEWCGYCKQFAPIWKIFKEKIIANKSNYNADIEIIDVEESKCNDLCTKYNINGFPTVIFHIDDNIINYTGGRNVESLELFLNKYISK